MKIEKHLLTRSNLRDLIILCCLVSSTIYSNSVATMVFGFFLLAIGCFLHIVAKGILIRNVVLCNRGIYAVVRHPYYLANYLIDCSFCVLSGNIFRRPATLTRRSDYRQDTGVVVHAHYTCAWLGTVCKIIRATDGKERWRPPLTISTATARTV